MGFTVRREDVLVSTDWLAAHLEDPSVRVLDCRYYFDRDPLDEYRAAHIPGAVHFNWVTELSDPDSPYDFIIAPPEQVERAFSRIGIDDETLIVAYDDEGGHYASRVWLILARYGRHERIRILEGGWTKWLAEGRPTSTDVPEPKPARFTVDPAGRPEIIATTDDVQAACGDSGVVILDVRRRTEFTGEEVRAQRGGRIPGAAHRLWQENLRWEADRTFLPDDTIRELHESRGVTSDRPVITYCQGGVRAAHAALALWMAGYDNVRVYDGSWAEWGNRDDVPIESGEPNTQS